MQISCTVVVVQGQTDVRRVCGTAGEQALARTHKRHLLPMSNTIDRIDIYLLRGVQRCHWHINYVLVITGDLRTLAYDLSHGSKRNSITETQLYREQMITFIQCKYL